MKEILKEFEYLPGMTLFLMSSTKYGEALNYANLITQPLTKGMFVPCDEEGNVLEEPERNNYLSVRAFTENLNQYLQAKDRVIFEEIDAIEYEGIKCYHFMTDDEIETIEDAINAGVKLKHK